MITPSPHQDRFASLRSREALYGAPAGGGNTAALVLAALRGTEASPYKGLLLCRDAKHVPRFVKQVAQFMPPEAAFNSEAASFVFPSGATIRMESMDRPCDSKRFGMEYFTFIGFDRVLSFTAEHYLAMAHRVTSLSYGFDVPARVRVTGDPEGQHAAWVRRYFGERDQVIVSPDDCHWFDDDDRKELANDKTLCW